LLLRDQLRVHQIDLGCWHGFLADLGRFASGWRFSSDVVQRVLVIRFEFRVLELPSLCRKWSADIGKAWADTTNIRPVWRLSGFLIVLANLVEIVFVELANKTGKIAVLEVFGQD
jgi:hypothetical protein